MAEEKKYCWKWRQNSSSRTGSWEYRYSYATNIEELYTELDYDGMLSSHSEHFRGIEGRKISKFPKEVIAKMIERAKSKVEYAEENLTELEADSKR